MRNINSKEMNRKKHKACIIWLISVILLGIIPNSDVFAETKQLQEDRNINNVKVDRVSDAEKLLDSFFKDNGYSLDIGTPE